MADQVFASGVNVIMKENSSFNSNVVVLMSSTRSSSLYIILYECGALFSELQYRDLIPAPVDRTSA